MRPAAKDPAAQIVVPMRDRPQRRAASVSADPTVLVDVYQEDINIAIWRRKLSEELDSDVNAVLALPRGFELSMTVTPESACSSITRALQSAEVPALCDDMFQLVDMFSCLLGIDRVGLRLSVLDGAMCPRFHVDHVPCRLVTTYCGVATEWLPHESADRSKLGRGSKGLSDRESGLYRRASDIRQMTCGDVALLKGELWEGNENAGLVHRSPMVPAGESRLLLTLDLMGR